MTHIRKTLISLCVAATSLGALAQNADEHKDHHPADASAPAKMVKKTAKAAPVKPLSADKMANMDQHMQSMQAMHDKMMAAKTPDERQALMAEHMKLMQEGMGMMKQMGAGMQGMGGQAGMGAMGGMAAGKGMPADLAARHQMMEKRMEMMESMMQMMMDRLPADANRSEATK
ncbi:hypothetical protein F5985_04610 [Malikia spinosa]|jgi:hypothetical protein|uniref:Uncharacterized protein n=2 Tax=Malikia spinosa TaxID=86180 RepID=A0A7C9IX31_9BURK|nr:hypothetical protein [Malikia spinosa]MYZ51434.1 hypothetical protein [Malikia spinosa]